FDNLALFRVHLRQPGECCVQGDQVHFFLLRTSVYTLVQRNLDHRTAALGRLMSARMIDKNAAHDVRRNPKEVCAVLPCYAVLVVRGAGSAPPFGEVRRRRREEAGSERLYPLVPTLPTVRSRPGIPFGCPQTLDAAASAATP